MKSRTDSDFLYGMRHDARMTTRTSPTTAHGQRLRDHREAAGLTIAEAYADLRAMLPKRYQPSITTLQRMETETPEEKWDGMVIFGLSKLYRCRIGDLSPMVADEYDEVGDLLASCSPWITTRIPGQLALLLPEPVAA